MKLDLDRYMQKLSTIFIVLLLLLSPVTAEVIDEPAEKPIISYEIVDVYADGTEVVREVRQTGDRSISPDQSVGQPLTGKEVALLGGSELALMLFDQVDFDQDGDDLASYLAVENGQLDLSTHDYHSSNYIADQDQDATSGEIVTADLDGNFREDVIFAITDIPAGGSTFDHEIRIVIQEKKAGEMKTMAMINGFGGAQDYSPQYHIPALAAGNIDDDIMDEFVVFGLDAGVWTAFVFDDLVGGNDPDQLSFGMDISLQKENNEYLYSTATTTAYGGLVSTSTAPVEYSWEIVDAIDPSSTEKIKLKDPIALKNNLGQYLSADPTTGALSFSATLNTSEVFYIEGSKGDYEIAGDLYANSFFTIRSAVAGYLDAGTTYTPVSLPFAFKVMAADNLVMDPRGGENLLGKITQSHLTRPFASGNYYDAIQNIAIGNVDGDARDEIVIVGMNTTHTTLWVMDDAVASFAELYRYDWASSSTNPNVALGDTDDDGRDEIAVTLTNSGSGSLYVIDDSVSGYAFTNVTELDTDLLGFNPDLDVADIDNDGIDEISIYDGFQYQVLYDDASTNYVSMGRYFMMVESFDNGVHADVVIADVNADAKNELVLAYSINDGGYAIGVFVWNDTILSLVDRYDPQISERQILSVATGDIYGNQFSLQYQERSGEFQTAGEISVVAAAPPVQLGLTQNYDFSGTTFGQSASSSTTEGNEISSGYGYYLNFQIKPTFFDVVEVGVDSSISFSSEFTQTNTITTTKTVTTEFTGGYLDDFVLYTSTKYKSFLYTVLAAPDVRLLGQNLTINIPSEPRLFLETKEYYNTHNDPTELDINENVFSHTPGQISTYPTQTDLFTKSYANSIVISPVRTVGQGGGSQAVEIDLAEDITEGFISTTSESQSVGGSATLFGVGGGGGGTWSSSESRIHETTMGSNTVFRADVGSIADQDEYTDFVYDFGMAVFAKEVLHLQLIHQFFVIDFWVDLPVGWGGDQLWKTSVVVPEVDIAAEDLSSLATSLPAISYLILMIGLGTPILLRRKS